MADRSLPLTIENPIEPTIEWSVGMGYRRLKAATILGGLWLGVAALHLISWGYLIAWGISSVFCWRALRLVATKVAPPPVLTPPQTYPFISMAIAAKNEAAVIANVVENLCSLDYPADRYEVWAIDDNSTDRTPEILDDLARKYPQLQVLHRTDRDSGGKSGALNQVLSLMQGEIIGVFDADATVNPDFLHRVLAYFQNETVGAIQLRKAITNSETNFLTRGQRAEMALDAYLQQQRTGGGGIGELRGNGQFVRRSALTDCEGWNEQTITDDLDLTIRLHLTGWDIALMPYPSVGEEGVTTVKALWHQRNRWAEGGFQRYLDYWEPIASNRMGTKKTLDLLSFLSIQYLLPPAGIPDFLMAFWLKHPPLLLPMTASLGVALPLWGIWVGLRRSYRQAEDLGADTEKRAVSMGRLFAQTAIGSLFILHWLVVMPLAIARMAILPKRLKWVKTLRQADL
ncbi:glycosyltransferase [Chamaesiphon polymorphus]|uniref:Beta-monoglucosyldiacylglycerol synthase n=1 Tax=Chamaesiphon polymorphus CCALA 037 TaxID=2107692 RepID=A0A2T1GN24_9CYAN|nr:glycosyltransferase family 2 protein [Chamaesiphon polymorphus]PSB59320.1 glycosyl transferase [Chamaesiphon polymorphus CCALA 037]